MERLSAGHSLPTSSYVKCRDTPEKADLAALRGIQHQNPVVRNQLSGAAVKKQQKHNLTVNLICWPSSVAYTKFAALYPVKHRTRFSGRNDSRLNRYNWTLSEYRPFLRICGIEKFLKAFPRYRNFRIVRSRRHKRVVGRIGMNRP